MPVVIDLDRRIYPQFRGNRFAPSILARDFERDDLPGMITLQRRLAARAGGGREVILVSRSLDEDMAKMYALMMRNEGKKVSVCRSTADAVRLLGPISPTPVVE